MWILQTLPVDRVRAVHPVVPPLGAARRLGGWDGVTAPIVAYGLLHALQRPGRSPTRWSIVPLLRPFGYIALTALVVNVVVAVAADAGTAGREGVATAPTSPCSRTTSPTSADPGVLRTVEESEPVR